MDVEREQGMTKLSDVFRDVLVPLPASVFIRKGDKSRSTVICTDCLEFFSNASTYKQIKEKYLFNNRNQLIVFTVNITC